MRVKRDWYQLDKQYIENLVAEMSKQIGDRFKAAQEVRKGERERGYNL